jgi:hypothetical protein
MNTNEILEELVVFLRNLNVLTTTVRGVTTATASGSLSNSNTITINVSNVKNIRSVTIDGVAYNFGSQYTVNYDLNNTCVITLSSAVTLPYVVSYDYGPDRIYPDYPLPNLSLSSFPRISVDFIDISSTNGGFGNVNINQYDITIVVYGEKKTEVQAYIKVIRDAIVSNMNSFYYMRVVKPSMVGPCAPSGGFEKFKNKIFQQNLDIRSIFNLEVV